MTCQRAYSITVEQSLSPAAWYTMETGNPLVDVVHGNNMPRILGTLNNVPAAGKVNLAGTAITRNAFARFQSAFVAALAPTGQDLNIFAWTRINVPVAPATLQQFITYVATGWPNSIQIIFVASGVYTVFVGATPTLTGVIPLSTFFFWQLRLNASTGNISLAINNGAPNSAPSGIPTTAFADAQLTVQFSNGGSPAYFQQLDELAVFTTNLSSADVGSIYNAGNGRTWP